MMTVLEPLDPAAPEACPPTGPQTFQSHGPTVPVWASVGVRWAPDLPAAIARCC